MTIPVKTMVFQIGNCGCSKTMPVCSATKTSYSVGILGPMKTSDQQVNPIMVKKSLFP